MSCTLSRRSLLQPTGSVRSNILLLAAVGIAVSSHWVALGARAGLPGLTDTANHPPPTTGTYAYNSFVPPNIGGASYVDPVFGSTIRRITTDHGETDIYARNMWWNADATRFYERGKIIDTTTGAVTHTVPTGDPNYDAGFDPIDPNVCFYFSGSTIHKVTLGANGAKTDVVYLSFPAATNPLGGSMNWLDASGRLLLVSYGSEPSLRVYDRQNLAAGPFTGAAPNFTNGGYSALSPDGKFVLTFGGEGSSPGYGTGKSWSINIATRTVAAVSPNFWSYCGDHGTFISPSDGKDYMIVFDCYNHHDVMRVDVTRNVSGQNEDGQRAGQKVLLADVDWGFDAHFSAVARGAYRDWVFLSTEDGSDGINASVGTWKPYRQEIIGINVLTGEVRRLAHHRSRGRSDYYAQPRVCVSWDGQYVGWASNFNQSGVHDIFLLPFASDTGGGDTTPPIASISAPANGATVLGTIAVSASAADNVGVAGVQLQVGGVDLGPEITVAPYSANWNTAAGADGTYALTAIARDAAGNATTSSPVTVMVQNTAPQIMGVGASGITPNAATIVWTTNQAANTQVNYGPTTAYANSSTLNTSLVTAHSQALTGLTAGTTYHYRVKSANSGGLLTTSGDFTFTTVADAVPPTVSLTTPANSAIVSGAIAVSATVADNIGVAGVQFQVGGVNLGPEVTAAPYSTTWNTTASADGSYVVTAIAHDAAGNTTTSAPITVTVQNTAPQITGVGASGITTSAATITWTTNQAANTQVNYGPTTAYASSTTLNSSMVTSHSQALTGLTAGTTYHYRVKSANSGGLLTTSGDFTFTTVDTVAPTVSLTAPANGATVAGTVTVSASTADNVGVAGVQFQLSGVNLGPEVTAAPYSTTWNTTASADGSNILTAIARDAAGNAATSAPITVTVQNAAPQITAVTASGITMNAATITWTTSQVANTQVNYGPTTAYASSTTLNSSMVTLHSQALTGLTAGTTYHYRVKSANSTGTLTTSGDFTFTTVADTAPPTVSISAPANGATVAGTVTVSASASDNVSVAGVQVQVSGVNLGPEVTAAPYSTTWNTAASADGPYTLTAIARDAAGNTTTSAPITVTVQNAAPQITAVAASGVTASAATITWTTNQAANTQVNYGPTTAYASSTTLNSSMVTLHSQALTGLTAGTIYHYRVKSANSSGLLTTSADFTFTTVDTVPPTVSLTAPASGATVSGAIAVSATVADNIGVAGVQFQVGGVNLGPEVTAAPYSTTWNTAASADGPYTLTAIARDAAGNTTTSAPITVTVQNAAPQITAVTASGITTSAATITWTTNQAANTQVNYGPTTAYASSTTVNTSVVTSHSQALTGLTAGTTYHYRVKSANSGGLLTTSGDFTFTTVDTVAPTVSLTAPTNGATVAGTIAVTATASDTVGVAGVQFQANGVNLGPEITVAPYTATWSTTATADGSYILTAIARDAASNATTSAPITVTVQNAGPQITAVAASGITTMAATITWTTSQAANTQVSYGPTTAYASSTTLNTSLVTSHSQALTGLTAGTTYHYRVKSANSGGLLTTSGDFTFTTVADTAPPTVSISAPANGASVSGTVTVTAAASDTVGVAGVQFQLSGVNLGPEVTAAPYSTTWNTTASADGSYILTAIARDAAGNAATSALITVTVQNAAPQITAVTASGITTSAATITWTTNQAANTQVNYGPTTAYASSTTLNAALVTSHSQTLAGLTAGTTYHYRVKSANSGGLLTTSGDFTFTTVDTVAPTVSLTAPANGATVAGTVTVSASTADNVGVAGVQFQLSGVTLGPEVTAAPYSTTWNTAASADGPYTLTAIARDAAGNATTSAPITVTVQNAAPQITAVAASGVTASAATITWTTNQAANTQVNYGPTTAYASSTTLNSSMLTSHSQTLTGLTAGTTYHYRAKSANSSGMLTTSGDFTFTAVDTVAPTVSMTAPTSGATVSGTVTVSATVADNVGVTGVQFRANGVTLGPEITAAPYSASWNTAASTDGSYILTAVARDAAGNTTTSSPIIVTVQNTAPQVTAILASSLSTTSATISWTTSQAANSQVNYGLTTAYGSSTTLNNSMVTLHSQALTGLTAGATYHYRVKSANTSGILTTSGDFTFTTSGAPASMSPAPGSTLMSSAVTFAWSAGTGVSQYVLWLGTTGVGSSNLAVLDRGLNLNAAVTGLPTNGTTLYVRLWSLIGGTWTPTDYTYAAVNLARMTTPAPGSTLTASTMTFQWSAGTNASQYVLWAGTTGVGSNNLAVQDRGTNLSGIVTGLPTNGSTIYVRLWSLVGSWQFNDYTYTALTAAPMTSPMAGSALTASTVTFQWTAAAGATQYILWVGSTVGANDLVNQDAGTGLGAIATGLPVDGRTLYVRLWSLIGTWRFNDYTYTAANAAPITSPTPGSTLPGSSATFQWTAGTGASQYFLWVGTSVGANNLASIDRGTNLSGTVTGLPVDGSTIYVRLWSLISGTWLSRDYTYTASGAPTETDRR